MAKYFHIRMVYIPCVNNLTFSVKCRVSLFTSLVSKLLYTIRFQVFLGGIEHLNTALFPFPSPTKQEPFYEIV
jgi:hypothetical protein